MRLTLAGTCLSLRILVSETRILSRHRGWPSFRHRSWTSLSRLSTPGTGLSCAQWALGTPPSRVNSREQLVLTSPLWIPRGQPVTASVALTFISRDRKEIENNELALPLGESPGLLGGCPRGAQAALCPVSQMTCLMPFLSGPQLPPLPVLLTRLPSPPLGGIVGSRRYHVRCLARQSHARSSSPVVRIYLLAPTSPPLPHCCLLVLIHPNYTSATKLCGFISPPVHKIGGVIPFFSCIKCAEKIL